MKFFTPAILVVTLTLIQIACASKPVGSNYISDTNLVLKKRVEMFDALVKEIDRIDADRKNILRLKDENWDANVNDIRSEVEKATNLEQLGRALKKIDSLYPHVQSQQILNPDLESVALGSKVVLPFKMVPNVTDPKEIHFRYFISQVSPDDFEAGAVPQIGDEVIEINKKGMEDWEQENYTSCKSVSHITCALELNHNFRNEILSWNHHQPVELRVLRRGQKLTAKLKAKIDATGTSEASESADAYNDVYPCGIDFKRRYFEFGFLYKGRRLCVLGSHAHPGIAVMRISNFSYGGGDDSIRSVRQEVDAFKKAYWNQHYSEIKHLVIDLIDSDGGDSPVAYESLLFHRPFQGQYVKYKKLKEWIDDSGEETLFSLDGDGGKYIWLKSLKEQGTFKDKNLGEFFEPIPRYCVSSKLDCRKGRFEPDENIFKGDVKVMINQNCILSCASFASDLAENIGSKVSFYGIPDSGDPLSAQIAVNLFLTPDAARPFTIKSQVWDYSAPPVLRNLLLTQTIAFSESTDAAGTSTSGVSRSIYKMPAISYKNYPSDYPADVLKMILRDLR